MGRRTNKGVNMKLDNFDTTKDNKGVKELGPTDKRELLFEIDEEITEFVLEEHNVAYHRYIADVENISVEPSGMRYYGVMDSYPTSREDEFSCSCGYMTETESEIFNHVIRELVNELENEYSDELEELGFYNEHR